MWGREMRAGLAFVLISLLVGGAFREWRRAHEERFADLVARLENRSRAAGVTTSTGLGVAPGSESGPSREIRTSSPPLSPAGIDVDRAPAAELERLPGIGPALAARIVADRASRGPFMTSEALLRVPGIGPRILTRIRPFLAAPAAADSGTPIAN